MNICTVCGLAHSHLEIVGAAIKANGIKGMLMRQYKSNMTWIKSFKIFIEYHYPQHVDELNKLLVLL